MGDVWLNEAQWRNDHTISHLSSPRHCCRPTHTHTQRQGEMSLKWEPRWTSIQPSISMLGKIHSISIFYRPNQCHIVYTKSQTALEMVQPASISSEPSVQPLTWLITCFIKAVTTNTHTHTHISDIMANDAVGDHHRQCINAFTKTFRKLRTLVA